MKKTLALLSLIPTLSFGQWVQIGNDINGEAPGDAIGTISLSADGSVVAIGSNLNQGNGSGAGHVRVFENIDGTWVQIGSDIDGDFGDQTGQYVSLSSDGTTVAVGEPISAINGSLAGQARVFRNVDNAWTQIGNPINGDSFNWQTGSVSLSADGSILAVGARGANVEGLGPFSGKARIYAYQSGNWVQIGNDINAFGAEDYFGMSISLSEDGSIVAIGAIGNPFNGDIGYVSVFENLSGVWTPIGAPINGSTPAGEFGYCVSLSADGSIVASGERNHISGRGSAQVFSNENGVWTQIGDTLFGQAVGDQFGLSVSLSGGGNFLAVGSFANDSNGLDAGSTSIFENQQGNWVPIGNVINGELAGDLLGGSVSLSSDGSIVAISAAGNDDNGLNAGQIRIFENSAVSNVSYAVPENSIKIYPNPAADVITLSSESEIASFELYSLLGELIMGKKAAIEKEMKINISALPAGTYLIKLKTNSSLFHHKVLKQ